MKYIKAYKEYIPMALQGKAVVEIDLDNVGWQNIYSVNLAEQFVYERIISPIIGKNSYNGRIREFVYGQGLLFHRNRLLMVICENRQVLLSENLYDAEIVRIKKMLKVNGYNTKKDILFMKMSNFIYDILSPSMDDYNIEKQYELSAEFLGHEINV